MGFDIYPCAYCQEPYGGQLWYVPKGIDSLRMWSNYQKLSWVTNETGPIRTVGCGPTPGQMKTEIWL